MNARLRDIIDELCELDPGLRSMEAELVPILEKLLAAKPDVTPDKAFVQKLRVMLRDKAASSPVPSPSFFSFFTMANMNYAVTGAVLGAIVTGPIVYSIVSSGGMTAFPSDDSSEALFSYSVEETSDGAFGSLRTGTDAAGQQALGEAFSNPRPQSGGGGGDAAISNPVSDKMMLYPPELTEYDFVFEGEMPALTESQVDVYKRQKGMSGPGIGSVLRSFKTGLIDLSSFGDAKTDSISFYEDKPYGYQFYVNFREGSLSINSYWERWPHPESACRDDACFNRLRVNIDEVPSDEDLIAIASDFASDHGFDLFAYGAPEVDKVWRRQYDLAENKSEYWIPDVMRVVWPQLIDDQPIFDEGGGKVGISMGVSVREKRVSDAWGIMDQKLLKSAYAAVTDAAMITDYVNRSGEVRTDWMPEGTTVKQATVTLGAPERSFVKMWIYDDATGTGDEVVVPALVFPVVGQSDGANYWRSSVTVPLAKELLEETAMPGQPIPLIMEDEAAVR